MRTIAVAGIFAIGLVSGLTFGPILHLGTQPAAGDTLAVSPRAAGQAHALWLQGELDSYATSQGGRTSGAPSWLAYRQFRLSEEGYAP